MCIRDSFYVIQSSFTTTNRSVKSLYVIHTLLYSFIIIIIIIISIIIIMFCYYHQWFITTILTIIIRDSSSWQLYKQLNSYYYYYLSNLKYIYYCILTLKHSFMLFSHHSLLLTEVWRVFMLFILCYTCLLYTSDAADE